MFGKYNFVIILFITKCKYKLNIIFILFKYIIKVCLWLKHKEEMLLFDKLKVNAVCRVLI